VVTQHNPMQTCVAYVGHWRVAQDPSTGVIVSSEIKNRGSTQYKSETWVDVLLHPEFAAFSTGSEVVLLPRASTTPIVLACRAARPRAAGDACLVFDETRGASLKWRPGMRTFGPAPGAQ